MKKRNITRLLATLLCLVMVLGMFVGCSSSETTDTPEAPAAKEEAAPEKEEAVEKEPYRIAMIGPLTGDGAQYGQAYKNAIEIYRDKINAEGGIDGHLIEVDFYDDKKDPKETLNAANLIVADGEYLAVIGSQTSGCSLAAAPVLQKAGIPMISPHASHADFTGTGDFCFTLVLNQAYMLKNTAEFMYNEYNSRKVAMIYANDDWGVQNRDLFLKYFEPLGGEVVAMEAFTTGSTKDFTTLLTKCTAAEPDTIFLVTNYNEGVLAVQQMKDLDIKLPVFCDASMYNQAALAVLGEDGNGLTMMNSFDINNHSGDYAYLEEHYLEKVGSGIDSYATHSYDAINIICDAIRANGPSREGIRDYITNLVGFEGTSGTITMHPTLRSALKNTYALTIEDGDFVQLDYVAVADPSFVP